MQSIIERMNERPLVFDGAMGTVIYERGVFINTCYDELNLTNPALIRSIHRDYLDAGAQVIETNTFGANRIKLTPHGLGDRFADINRAAVACARQAIDGAPVYLAASIGPCTRSTQALAPDSLEGVRAAFAEQMEVLAREGVDALVLETFSKLDELLLAAEVARTCALPLIASFAVDHQGITATGTPAADMVTALERCPGVGAIGINCGTGPQGALSTLESVIHLTTKPIVVMPNAGLPREVEGRMLYLNSPEYFTTYAQRIVERGARGIGGCCGTTPAHIATMVKTVTSLSGVKQFVAVKRVEESRTSVTVIPPERKSRWSAKLAAGEQVTSVELVPPRSVDMGPMIAKARLCAHQGIDAINIPDGPRASTRVSPMIAAIELQRNAGIEPVLHYCCRDRNLIGMQADLLGTWVAGVHNLLIITGDPPKLGDYPDATGVFDVDAIGLVQATHNLNHGFDIGHNPVDPPTGFCIGIGANPCAVDPEREFERYRYKVEAGAEFAITQPVFDVEALLRFLDRTCTLPRQIPVVAGVWPLVSFRNAEFMNNEVPGVTVTDSVLERLHRCTTREEGIHTGIAIAREIIAALADSVAGFQVSAPFGKVELALAALGKGSDLP